MNVILYMNFFICCESVLICKVTKCV